jgi:hypothetical protein
VDRNLLARLLTDPVFRAAYLAGRASPLEALETRESRSSLAGVVAGTAVEAVALLGFADDAHAAIAPVLENHNLTFDTDGLADLRAGRIDPRVVSVLDRLSREHHLTISSMRSDHGRLTAGGSVSNHSYGRAVDIAAIDGRPVTPDNAVARQIALELSRLDPAIRPTEIGSPWALPGAAYFTDGDHQNHLHIAFDDPLDPSKPLPVTAPPNAGDGTGGDNTADTDDNAPATDDDNAANPDAENDNAGNDADEDDNADADDDPDADGDPDADADPDADGDPDAAADPDADTDADDDDDADADGDAHADDDNAAADGDDDADADDEDDDDADNADDRDDADDEDEDDDDDDDDDEDEDEDEDEDGEELPG